MPRLYDVPMHERYTVNEFTGCWIYRGSVDSEGYGRYGSRMAHRHYYEQLVGPVPVGLDLDHLCVRRNCVNPAHLEPVTAQENQRRSAEYRPIEYSRRKSCRRGHELVGDNVRTYVRTYANGKVHEERQCITCRKIKQSERRRKP